MSEAPKNTAPSTAPRGAGWLAMVIIGSIICAIALALIAASVSVSRALSYQSTNGYLVSPSAQASTNGFALTSPAMPIQTSLDPDQFPRIRVSISAGSAGDSPVFVGIGPSDAVRTYLDDVHVAEVTGLGATPLEVATRDIDGSRQPELPQDQSFWVTSDSDSQAAVEWQVAPGNWTIVVMNADATAGVDTRVSAGVEAPWALPAAATLIGLSIGMLLLGSALVIWGVFGWGRERRFVPASVTGFYPTALTGELQGDLSRGLWLVKWILVIPHWIVLGILWVAFIISTIFAGFAILFTGSYPRAIFEFNVGVLRWSWRVGFYAYSALATDKYPPFSLEPADYPAGFEVAYPERLSRGLVLVKWWLLALPHIVVVAVLANGWQYSSTLNWATGAPGASLLSLLVLITGVILLFTRRYQRPLFDLIMGINRWAYRVTAYVALMRDEYPPFRLDQGGLEPTPVNETPLTERREGLEK